MSKNWLRDLLGGTGERSLPIPQVRLNLETLEDRCVPTITVQSLAESPLLNAAALAKTISGNGVQITGASYTGSPLAAGIFYNGSNELKMSSGIVLDTGRLSDIPGTFSAQPPGRALGQAGDAQLNTLLAAVNKTQDASALTFNFVAQGPIVNFTFVYATNDINAAGTATADGSSQGDIFGAFLNGQNVAIPPVRPVVLVQQNRDINNDPRNTGGTSPLAIKFDRVSIVITISAAVVPGQLNTMKLVIADTGTAPGGDPLNDSAVFIQASSLMTPARVTAYYPQRYTYNASTRTFDGFINIGNIGSQALSSTFLNPLTGTNQNLTLVFNNLPAGVKVVSPATVLVAGKPAVNLNALPPGSFSIGPNQFLRLPVKFSNPSGAALPTFFTGNSLIVEYV